jgi:hypothetical protein
LGASQLVMTADVSTVPTVWSESTEMVHFFSTEESKEPAFRGRFEKGSCMSHTWGNRKYTMVSEDF